MSLMAQAKLLRVLEERRFERLGGNTAIDVNFRLISATNRPLEQFVRDTRFREDLYYRVNAFSIRLPSLRERRDDIPILAQHFLDKFCANARTPVTISQEAMRRLMNFLWPGNVRQLFNVVEQVCALSGSPLIPLALVQRALRVPSVEVQTYADAKQRFERDYLVGLLKLTDGNVADAARLADRNRTELYRLLQKHELTPGHFKADPVSPAA
jgi:two-component system response regulator GlrR